MGILLLQPKAPTIKKFNLGCSGLHAELASAQTEADFVRNKLLKVEEDVIKYKTKNTELNEELLRTLGTKDESFRSDRDII